MKAVAQSALAFLAAGCALHAGNDPALAPQIAVPPRSTQLTVHARPGSHVAAFAAVRRSDGWALVPLRSSAMEDSATSTGVATFETNVMVPAQARIRAPRASPAFPKAPNRDACAMGPPDQYGTGGHATSYGVAQTSMYYDWGCSQFLRDPGPPSLPSYTLPASFETVNAWTGQRYVLVVTSTVPRTDGEWSALADSLGAVSRLTAVPGRLGRMAFGRVDGARWVAEVETISTGR